MRWLRFFDALARGERWAVRGLVLWVGIVMLVGVGLWRAEIRGLL